MDTTHNGEDLLDKVITQVKTDILGNDIGALYELLDQLPTDILTNYLPQE